MNSSRRIFFILRVFVATLFVAFQASVSMPAPFSFMHSRAFLVSMPAGSMYPNHCFSFTINSIIGGKQSNVVAATTINLTSTGTISFFSDFACSTAATTATIAAGASSVVVYMMATSTGSETITLTASAFKPQTQSRLVATNPFIWTGGAGTNTWATGANWSGGTAPNSTQIAFFDGNCVTFCSPMITASVGGIRMLSGFTGTVYQNTAGATTIGTSGFWQAAGTFEGSLGGDTLNLSGHFVLSGGTFKAPSGNLDIGAAINWRVSGAPTFTHNSGTIRNPNHFMGLSITPGSVDYFNVSILGRQNTVTNYGTWKIKGTLTIDSPDAASAQTWNLGTTEVGGDLIIKGQGTNGTALFKVNGSANQLIDGSTATNARISNLSIESTGGTVSLAGTIMILGDYKKLSGAMNGGTSTLYLENAWQGRNHTFGGGVTETYNNVTFTASNGSHTLTGEANISGTLTLNSTNAAFGTLDGGTLNVSGDLEGIGYGMRGSTVIRMDGNISKAINYGAAQATARAPRIEIAKTGVATMTLSGTINFTDIWKWESGTIVPGTSTLRLTYSVWGGKTVTPGETQTYYNFSFDAPGGATTNIMTSLNASNNITFATNGADYHMPTPGTGLSINATGTLTLNTGVDLFLHGATKTHGILVNNGTITP